MKGLARREPTTSEKLEYEQANEWWRMLSQTRRRDMMLFTGAQGAVLTIIGADLLALGPDQYALSAVAFVIALIGLNNEHRLYRYLAEFRERGMRIEKKHGMSLLTRATREVKQQRGRVRSVRSTLAFKGYYVLIAAGWLALWIINAL